MKILQVSTTEAIGQAFNGYLLNKLLKDKGHETSMAVYHKLADGNESFRLGSDSLRELNREFERSEYEMSLQNTLVPAGLDLLHREEFKKCDVVHLQLVQSVPFFSIYMIELISKLKPVVLSIHDLWFITGHCIHPLECERWKIGCGDCPDLRRLFPMKQDFTRLNWIIKQSVYSQSKMHVVVASDWLVQRITQSPLLKDKPLHLIPFGFDEGVFRRQNKSKLRAEYGIPNEAQVIFFRNLPSSDLKGIPFLKEALKMHKPSRPTYILTVQEVSGFEDFGDQYKFMHFGEINDPVKMSQLYNLADVFLMPSLAETFGMMAVESMACGVPVLYFEGTAIESLVEDQKAGLKVQHSSSVDLAKKLEIILKDEELRENLGNFAEKVAKGQFSLENYVENHIDVYKKVYEDFHA